MKVEKQCYLIQTARGSKSSICQQQQQTSVIRSSQLPYGRQTSITPTYRWKNWSLDRFSGSPEVTQLVSDRTEVDLSLFWAALPALPSRLVASRPPRLRPAPPRHGSGARGCVHGSRGKPGRHTSAALTRGSQMSQKTIRVHL